MRNLLGKHGVCAREGSSGNSGGGKKTGVRAGPPGVLAHMSKADQGEVFASVIDMFVRPARRAQDRAATGDILTLTP